MYSFLFVIKDSSVPSHLLIRADSYSSAIRSISDIFGDCIMNNVCSITKLDSFWIKH